MKRIRTIIVCILVAGCAGLHPDNYKRPAMTRRDREDYMVASGGPFSWDIKIAFREGRIVRGMPYYLVEAMYGEPDLVLPCPRQNLICDRIAVYQTNTT